MLLFCIAAQVKPHGCMSTCCRSSASRQLLLASAMREFVGSAARQASAPARSSCSGASAATSNMARVWPMLLRSPVSLLHCTLLSCLPCAGCCTKPLEVSGPEGEGVPVQDTCTLQVQACSTAGGEPQGQLGPEAPDHRGQGGLPAWWMLRLRAGQVAMHAQCCMLCSVCKKASINGQMLVGIS